MKVTLLLCSGHVVSRNC